MAVQLGTSLAFKVVGIAGSEAKCKWVESLGADEDEMSQTFSSSLRSCVNYRDADYQKKLDEFLGESTLTSTMIILVYIMENTRSTSGASGDPASIINKKRKTGTGQGADSAVATSSIPAIEDDSDIIKQWVDNGEFELEYVRTDENFADIFTKALVRGPFFKFVHASAYTYGRIIACGAMAGYNDKSKMGVNAWGEIISISLTVQGFIVFGFFSEFPEAIKDIVAIVKSGKVTPEDGVHVEDLSKSGKPLAKVPEVWHKLFTEEKPSHCKAIPSSFVLNRRFLSDCDIV